MRMRFAVRSFATNILPLFLALIACLPAPARGEHNRAEAQSGTIGWHYDPDNKVMEEGHRRIREWRQQIEGERRAVSDRVYRRADLPPPPPGSADIIPAPLPLGTEHAFANGMIKGRWIVNRITNNTSGSGYGAGVRLDRTVYDPVGNIVYALTTEKNLVEAPLTQLGSWMQRNQAILIEKKGFTGVNTPDGKFRLIGSVDGKFRFSDDKGMTWEEAVGGGHDRAAVYWTETMANGNILSLVRKRVANVSQDAIIRSTDYGKTFTDLQLWPASQSSGIVATRLYNTDDYCLVVRNRSGGGTWEIHKYEKGVLGLHATVPANGTPSTITGTFSGGVKVYVGNTANGGYYSDGGTSWVARSTLRSRLETVDPNRPNLLFSNSAQHDYSSDGGMTWQVYPSNDNTIGWDPKHLTYHKVKGAWVFVAANDMGLCFNPDPLVRAGWQYVNDNHVYAILHGGTAVDHTALTVTSNQDPGTFELTRTGTGAYLARNKNSADGLRAAASNNGKAYWYRHYWETFMHSHAAFTKDNRKANFDMPGTWFTPPFKGSTAPGEDAIYVTGQAQLAKLTYNATGNSITRSNLAQNFQTLAGDVTWGVGVAKSDPARLYVATKNGRFFWSANAGQSWTETGYAGTKPTPQTSPAYNQSSGFYIEVADTDPNLVFWGAGSGAGACLISRDGGKTFASTVAGLPAGEKVGALSLSPDGKLAFSSNFFVYVEANKTWYDLKAASMPAGALPAAVGVNYLPMQRKVRYFTWGSGVVDLDITFLNTPDVPAVALEANKCYQVTASHSDKALSLGVSGVQQAAWVNGTHQKWQFYPVDGFYRIAGTGDYKALEVASESYEENAALRATDWTGADNQKWNVFRDGEGLYAIVARHSVKAMNVAGATAADGAPIQQATYFGQPNQKWKITETPNCVASGIPVVRTAGQGIRIARAGAQGRFKVTHGAYRAFDILVYDAFGKFILGRPDADAFDLAGHPGGLYYVKVRTDHLHVTERITYTP